jgi:predicted component of type VI protein secretion system
VPLTEDARRAIKVAAPDEIDRLVRMRLDGVSLAELREPPPGVPKRRDARFLGLRASGLVWRRIAETGAVAVHVPTAIPATRVELVAVP